MSLSQVARVIIEASSHKVHLRKANTLTFDSTGSSRPLDAIASNLSKFLGVPYIRCDCRHLVQRRKGKVNNNDLLSVAGTNGLALGLEISNMFSSSNPSINLYGRTK